MVRIIKNTMLNYVPTFFEIERNIKPERVYLANNSKNFNGKLIVYLMEREIRMKNNFAFLFALNKSKESGLPLKIICPKNKYKTELKQNFIDFQIIQTRQQFLDYGYDFEFYEKDIFSYLIKLNPECVVIDFNPILNRNWINNLRFTVYEIDGHNITPARFVSSKQEYSAATLRNKIYKNISYFLSDFEQEFTFKTESEMILEDFIKNKLPFYNKFHNNFAQNYTSNLSKYINLGFISSQKVAIEIIKSEVSNENKEAFLEELIIRKELADNFCLYCNNFKSLSCLPSWARQSLKNHQSDLRAYLYDLKTLENAQTHDELWNATQRQLVKKGIIHSYLRMYWAKKFLEWTTCFEEALSFAVYLNDKYAYDSPSPNGYVGILWAIGGLHDRPFKDWFVTGKIRRMTYSSLKKKFDVNSYIQQN